MNEIETTFQEYLAYTYTNGKPTVEQEKHCRYAFYAGVMATLMVGSTERAEKWLDECVAFKDRVKEGKA